MKRGGPLIRKTPMRRASKGLCAQKRAQRRAYAAAADAQQCWCTACGKAGPVEHSHLLTQRAYPELRNNPLNWQLLCRACHEIYEHNKAAFAIAYPEAWAAALKQIEVLAPRAYAFTQLKHPAPSPLPATEKGRG